MHGKSTPVSTSNDTVSDEGRTSNWFVNAQMLSTSTEKSNVRIPESSISKP